MAAILNIFVLLLAMAPPPTPAVAPPASDAPAAGVTDRARPRAIVRASRLREVGGFVELEDDEIIVLRRLDGEIESFTKARVLKIIQLTEPQPGQDGTVVLRSGQVSRGEILEDGFDRVVVSVEGIRVEFKRSAVETVILVPTFDELYERFKANLQPNQLEDHLDLCRWLVNRHRYDLAMAELNDLLAQDRHHDGARKLRQIVQAQIDLQGGALPPASQPEAPFGSGSPDGRAGPVRPEAMLPSRLVTAEDVNLMRVYEIDFERPPKVSVPPETIRSLLETYGASKTMPASAEWRTALFRADPVDIVSLMFELRLRELYPQIDVITEPYSLNMFRQRVHNTWLMNSCSTSRCHGGPDGGRFFLHHRRHKDERVRYTNLLILERLDLDPRWPLINYDAPIDSLIVQHGLPREIARRPHPDVRGWKPIFTRGRQRMLDDTLEWIRTMMQPRPDYPVDFEPEIPGMPGGIEEDEPGPETDEESGRAPR